MAQHPTLNVMRILWMAMLIATTMYVGLAFSGILKPPPEPVVPMMPFVFGLLSLVLTIVSFALPRSIHAAAARAAEVEIREEAPPDAFSGHYREAMEKRRVFADPAAAMAKAYTSYMTPFVLSIAFSEAIALFGLVLAFLGFEKILVVPFFVAGATLIAIRFPTQPKILDAFEAARGATFPSSTS
ncbi:hypothetical protein [Polyangium sp. 15x6]|uniref:hypothetical protein n=1 Tax=Polyangium sp. 15x6 TaxID=3042687 RepID=UPI00249BF9C3|nr:hypothetical protein [Polyangium sp. 15x6]MDI3288679.1 hypothetical protein [Polyangium sp. 15x6]